MYGFSQQVDVLAVEANKRILVQWQAYGEPTPIEWLFTPRPDDTTFVSLTNSGFTDARQAIDSTEGFTIVVKGLRRSLLRHAGLPKRIEIQVQHCRIPQRMHGSRPANRAVRLKLEQFRQFGSRFG